MIKEFLSEDELAIAELEKDYLELSGFKIYGGETGDIGVERVLRGLLT